MFNKSKFIKNNLIKGYKNNSFSAEQVNIYALNYLTKGDILQNDFDEIIQQTAVNETDN